VPEWETTIVNKTIAEPTSFLRITGFTFAGGSVQLAKVVN